MDILVDLALHTAGNRLLVFARKPAPMQVAWLGYPGSSGVEAMDYRITDPWLDPPGLKAAGDFEEPVRLPDCWCCYTPPADSPAPGDLPAAHRGGVTFGSFNNFAKINDRVLEVWAAILRRVEGSRLLLLSKGGAQERAVQYLGRCGIAPERVGLLATTLRPTATAEPARRLPTCTAIERSTSHSIPFPTMD